jgi:hypothetical protein
MAKHVQVGDSIAGEKIVFECRDYHLNKKLIHLTESHRGKSGQLIDATCVIEKKFRAIPDKTS